MLRFLLQALLVAYLPGALILRVPGRSQAYRASLPAEERLFWSVLLSVLWSVMVVLLLASQARYTFERLLVANTILSAVVVIGARQHLRFPPSVSRWSRAALVPAGLLALGLWLYFPPAEYVLGGRDPGTYINEGIQIAQRGRLVLSDDVVSSVPPPFRDLFFPSHQNPNYYGLRFVGFFIQDPFDGSVVGQFPHLFPASIAIGYGLNGLSGARQAVGAWALLGLLAVYFVGARLFGRTTAAIATTLLAINVITVWFARYPNAELVMQAQVFAALLAFTRALDERQWFFPVVTGTLLGTMLFLRYDAVLPIASFLLASAMLPTVRQRIGTGFVIALGLTSAAGLWYLLVPMRAYSAYPLAFTRASGGWLLAAAGLVAWWAIPRVLAWERPARFVRQAVPLGLAGLLAVLAVYAYFFRQEGGRTAVHDAMALRTYSWYVTSWVIGIAVAGYVVFARRLFWRDPAFFLTFATFALFFLYKTRIVPEHFWAARRFLPMILPGTLLLAVAVVSDVLGPRNLPRLLARGRERPSGTQPVSPWLRVAGGLLLVASMTPLAMSYWTAAAPVRQHVEYAGLIPKLEQLAARIGDRDLLLVEARDAGSDLHVLAMPLAYIYARHVLVFDSAVPSKRSFEDFVAWASTRYDNLWFLGGGGTDLLTARVAAESIASEVFQVSEYAATLNSYPHGVRRKEFDYGLYRLRSSAPPAVGPQTLEIGVGDDLNVVRFHAKERRSEDGTTFRWTGPQSYVLLQGVAADAREMTIWIGHGGRPPQAPAATVEISLGDESLGTVEPVDAIRPYTFALPPDLARRLGGQSDPVRLSLRVPTWSPAAVIGGSDTRELGVMVARVTVR